MSKALLFLRTWAWAALGFLLANGVVLALLDAADTGAYATGVKQLVLAGIAAAVTGVIAAVGLLRFGESPLMKALNQVVQMAVAYLATLAVADLTDAVVVAWLAGLGRFVVSALISGLQTYMVNLYAQRPQPVEG